MKVENWPLEKIKPYPKNPRKNDQAVQIIMKSLKQFGWRQPITVDKDGVIIMGHTRLKAAQKLGLTTAPVHQALELSPDKVKALRIMDNKSNEYSEWIDDLLTQEIGELGQADFDLILTGFKQNEIDEILNSFNQTENTNDPDAVPEVVESICKPGDLWQLGNHKLLCGDSTKEEDVERLMDGEKADMVFTDPPYNINYRDMKKEFKEIENDKMPDDNFVEFLKSSIYWDAPTKYICCSWQSVHLFRKAMEESGSRAKALIVWNKVNPAQNLDKYFKAHEFILYSGKFGGEKTLRSDVWEIKRQRNILHPTMKPVELVEMAIQDTPEAKIISDSFAGSGTSYIACEKTNRRCFGMEIDPYYCSIILQRWADYTNKDPIREDGKKWSELKND